MKNTLKIIFLTILLSTSINSKSQVSEYVKIKDGVIHYRIFGEGEPILIINGGPGLNSDGFESLAKLLSKNYMAVLYDQRGTGKSKLKEVDSTTVTMDLMAEDIEELRKHLNIKEWVLLGHSFGGWMAEHYAVKYPESVKAMILSHSGGIDLSVLEYVGANMDVHLSVQEKDSLAYWKNKIKEGDTSHYAQFQKGKNLAPAYLFDRSFIPLIAERLTQGIPEISSLVYKDLRKIKFDCKESLKDFNKPVLIIQGRQDMIGDGAGYKAHQILKNSKLVFLNKCGHYGWLEQEELYIKEVEEFILLLYTS